MADSIADNAELAVDELKRKARRRLIGAIFLALAAATLLPLLLEQEQKPLGDDVSVQIPPVDEGKFISRLTGEKGKEAPPQPKADARAEAKGEVRPEASADAKLEPKADARSETKAEAMSEPKAGAKPEPKTGAEPEPKADTRSASKAGGRPEPVPAAAQAKSAPPAAEPAPSVPKAATAAAPAVTTPDAERPKIDGFIVQLGAFTDVYGANALSNRLKMAGYPAYTEPIDTSRGKLWRVRVGGYPSRAAAVEARDKLKADGHNGIVSAAK